MSEFTDVEKMSILVKFINIGSVLKRSHILGLAEVFSSDSENFEEKRDIYLAALNYYSRSDKSKELFRDYQKYVSGSPGEYMAEGPGKPEVSDSVNSRISKRVPSKGTNTPRSRGTRR